MRYSNPNSDGELRFNITFKLSIVIKNSLVTLLFTVSFRYGPIYFIEP